jgi:hypothetical protein
MPLGEPQRGDWAQVIMLWTKQGIYMQQYMLAVRPESLSYLLFRTRRVLQFNLPQSGEVWESRQNSIICV